MLMRSICGSLAAVGVIGGLAAALPEHRAQKATTSDAMPDFGALPKRLTAPAMVDPSLDAAFERQSLVRLAAYSISAQDSRPAVAPQSVSAAADKTTSDPSSTPATAAAASSGPATAAATMVASTDGGSQSRVAVQPADAAVASGLPPSQPVSAPPMTRDVIPAAPPKAAPSAGPARVNINHATVTELDHLPGGGRIGIAIARRRPYAAVDDLVRKRVVRASIFARIKTAITVD